LRVTLERRAAREVARPRVEGEEAEPATSNIVVSHGEDYLLEQTGTEYVGLGYNLVYGNPEGDDNTQLDPGLRLPLINLEWTYDAELEHGFYQPETTCYQNSDVSTSSSSEDYQEELSSQVDTSASGSGSAGGFSAEASFSASQGSQEFSNTVATTTDTRYTVTSYCLTLHVGYDPFTDWTKLE
jgi:sporozoite microneme protein 2